MRLLFLIIFGLLITPCLHGQCEDSSNNWIDSWTSCSPSANPNTIRGNSHWILYEFDSAHYITTSHVWNANRLGESGSGLKDVIIDYSLDGNTWIELGAFTFPQGTETEDYLGVEGPDFGSLYIFKILITVVNTHDDGPCASLAEVQFTVDNTKCHGGVDDCGECNGAGSATWYIDADGDGKGSDNLTLVDCDQPFGYVDNNTDICDSGELGWAEVFPLFAASCSGCHIEASAGGLSLASYDGFTAGGNICGPDLMTGGNLVGAITISGYNGCGTSISSPPMNERTSTPLTAIELDLLQRWIDGGATENCVDYCLEDDFISQTFGEGTVAYRQVSNEITSTSLIDSMTIILFDAGQAIDLEVGFEVKVGGDFVTKLDGCNTSMN